MRVDSEGVYEAEFELRRKLIELRRAAGLTQQQLAEKTGLSQQMISRIETGESNSTVETLLKYLEALGFRLEPVRE